VYPTIRLPERNSAPQFWTQKSATNIQRIFVDGGRLPRAPHAADLLNAQIALDSLLARRAPQGGRDHGAGDALVGESPQTRDTEFMDSMSAPPDEGEVGVE
jgi:hypothetical protein